VKFTVARARLIRAVSETRLVRLTAVLSMEKVLKLSTVRPEELRMEPLPSKAMALPPVVLGLAATRVGPL
jgi:hypothetical protein